MMEKTIYCNLSWRGVATLVNEVECERDTNNIEKQIDR